MKHLKLRIGVGALIGVDMLSKYFLYNIHYLDNTSRILPVLNKGISRSLPVPYFIIVIISILGVGAFIWLFMKKKIGIPVAALLIAGTIGNLIDRMIYWGVRDFIDINLFNFPIFNLADMMLSIGVIRRIVVVMLEKKK